MVTVGLLWHSLHSDNLGVGALTYSNIAIVEDIARKSRVDVQFRVFSWRDAGPRQMKDKPNVEIFQMSGKDILHPGRFRRWVKPCDFVLDISAGDSFSDIYGAKRFRFNIASKMVVLASGKPLIFSPQTIGPFNHWSARLLAGAMMRRARVVTTRDNLSTDYVEDFNLPRVIEATDVAFKLPYTQAAKSTNGKMRVGINLSGLLFNGGYTRSNMFGLKTDYPDLSRKLVSYFSSRKDCELHLVGHVNSQKFEVEDDYRLAQNLAAEFPGVIVAPRFADPPEAKSYISGLDYFAGSRMHACIAAFSSGVPVMPIAYSRKFSGVFGTLGYKHGTDCKTQTADEIVAAVASGFENRSQLQSEVDAGRLRAIERLKPYEAAVREAIQTARSHR